MESRILDAAVRLTMLRPRVLATTVSATAAGIESCDCGCPEADEQVWGTREAPDVCLRKQ